MTPQLAEIDRRLERGQSLTEIEDVIEQLKIEDDVKAALWLYAWVSQAPARRLYETRQTLLQLEARGQVAVGTD